MAERKVPSLFIYYTRDNGFTERLAYVWDLPDFDIGVVESADGMHRFRASRYLSYGEKIRTTAGFSGRLGWMEAPYSHEC